MMVVLLGILLALSYQNIHRQLKSCDDAIRQTLQDILKNRPHVGWKFDC